jgi:hypothetical protein
MRFMVVLIIGCCLLSLATIVAICEHSWIKRGNIAEGIVVELIPSRGSKGGTVYKPRVQYKTVDGRELTFTRSYSSSPPGFRVGERVAVAYHPGNEKARILTFGQRFGFSLILGVIGSALTFSVLAYRLGDKLVPDIYQKHEVPPVRKSSISMKNQA